MNFHERLKQPQQPIVISNPGTEKVVLNTTSLQLMECDSQDKHRYCLVEKGVRPQYSNQYMTAGGDRVHILTREVFNLILGLITTYDTQMKHYKQQAETLGVKYEAYEMLINGLRKHGVID